MKGFYFYCIISESVLELSTEGIGGGKVFIMPYQDLKAVVSEVSLEEFSSEEIQNKAQEDVNWIREKAQNHQKVIEEAMAMGPVIPMQFGVIFKTKEKLEETLSSHYEQFKQSLQKLAGKQEWGVKAYMNRKVFEEFLEKGSEEVLAKKKEAESLPKGMAFFAKKQAVSQIGEVREKELDKITGEIYESLSQLADSFNKAKILEKDFTGRIEEMILNCFYLIEESKLAQFQKKVEELKEKYNPIGIEVEMSGPWPSYHFA